MNNTPINSQLATKPDLNELSSQLRQDLASKKDLDNLNQVFRKDFHEFTEKITKLFTDFSQEILLAVGHKFDQQDKRFDRIEAILDTHDRRFDRLEDKVDAKIDQLRDEIRTTYVTKKEFKKFTAN